MMAARSIACAAGWKKPASRRRSTPAKLPSDPMRLLGPARAGAEAWLDADYKVMRFAPSGAASRPGEGPPHIRLDRAAEFLVGDRL